MESEYLQRPHGFRHTIWNCALFFCGLLGGGRKTALVSRVIHGQVSERERKEEGVVSRKDGREATENTLLHLLLDAPSFFLFYSSDSQTVGRTKTQTTEKMDLADWGRNLSEGKKWPQHPDWLKAATTVMMSWYLISCCLQLSLERMIEKVDSRGDILINRRIIYFWINVRVHAMPYESSSLYDKSYKNRQNFPKITKHVR